MLFVPPSMQSIIPEATAVTVQDRGDFHLYYNPTDKYANLETQVQSWDYFENQIEWLNQKFKLPHDVIVGIAECASFMPPEDSVNAYYASRSLTGENFSMIIICYELILHEYDIMEYLVTPGKGDRYISANVICKSGQNCPSAEDRTRNIIDFIFYHELGHALIDVYDLPIPTAEEVNADSLSAYILLEFSAGSGGNDSIRDAAWGYLLTSSVKDLPIEAYADTHTLNIQRFFNLACFAYGSDPSSNRDLIQTGLLDRDRAKGCAQEYKKLVSSWKHHLTPNMQTSTPTPAPTPTPAHDRLDEFPHFFRVVTAISI